MAKVKNKKGDLPTPMRKIPERNNWYAMVHRCTNPKYHKYPDYGGRGIKVCERWLESFKNFYEDMGPKPGPTYSIDRKDNDGDYTPDNCRWATKTEQGRNSRHNRVIEAFGKSQCVSAWAEEMGIPLSTLETRINKRGWCITRALLTPRDTRRLHRISDDVKEKIRLLKDSGKTQQEVGELFNISRKSVGNIWNHSVL